MLCVAFPAPNPTEGRGLNPSLRYGLAAFGCAFSLFFSVCRTTVPQQSATTWPIILHNPRNSQIHHRKSVKTAFSAKNGHFQKFSKFSQTHPYDPQCSFWSPQDMRIWVWGVWFGRKIISRLLDSTKKMTFFEKSRVDFCKEISLCKQYKMTKEKFPKVCIFWVWEGTFLRTFVPIWDILHTRNDNFESIENRKFSFST